MIEVKKEYCVTYIAYPASPDHCENAIFFPALDRRCVAGDTPDVVYREDADPE